MIPQQPYVPSDIDGSAISFVLKLPKKIHLILLIFLILIVVCHFMSAYLPHWIDSSPDKDKEIRFVYVLSSLLTVGNIIAILGCISAYYVMVYTRKSILLNRKENKIKESFAISRMYSSNDVDTARKRVRILWNLEISKASQANGRSTKEIQHNAATEIGKRLIEELDRGQTTSIGKTDTTIKAEPANTPAPLHHDADIILDFFEDVWLAINYDFADESYLKESLSNAVQWYHKMLKIYIDCLRNKREDPMLYIGIERLVVRWELGSGSHTAISQGHAQSSS